MKAGLWSKNNSIDWKSNADWSISSLSKEEFGTFSVVVSVVSFLFVSVARDAPHMTQQLDSTTLRDETLMAESYADTDISLNPRLGIVDGLNAWFKGLQMVHDDGVTSKWDDRVKYIVFDKPVCSAIITAIPCWLNHTQVQHRNNPDLFS